MSSIPKKIIRSMLFVPGSNAAMLSNAFIYGADAIMFDLEDSVTQSEKDSARQLVAHALQHKLYAEITTTVRVNPLDSEYGLKDLQAVIPSGVKIIRTPKTDTAQDIIDMDNAIKQIESDCGRQIGSTKILAAIESARGIVEVNEIAKASTRLMGIALGAEDYVRNLLTERSADGIELLFARCSILQAARANGIQAFDTVFSDANNIEGFIHEASLAKQLGFDGKSLINPRQIELLHHLYAPTKEAFEYAKSVIEAAKKAKDQGSGVASINGKMVDAPVIARAELVIENAKRLGVRED